MTENNDGVTSRTGAELTLTREDILRLKDGETVEFSHVIGGYRLSVSAEKMNLEDFVAEDDRSPQSDT